MKQRVWEKQGHKRLIYNSTMLGRSILPIRKKNLLKSRHRKNRLKWNDWQNSVSVKKHTERSERQKNSLKTVEKSSKQRYDITYDDGTHGTIRGTDLIRQIDEENLTQPLIVSFCSPLLTDGLGK